MRNLSLVVALCGVMSSSAYAELEGPPQGTSDRMTKEGAKLYNQQYSPLRMDLKRACVLDPANKFMARLADFDARVAKLGDAEDRRKLAADAAGLRAWVVKQSADVPGVGTWDAARAAVKAMLALSNAAVPAIGESDAEVGAMIDYATKVRKTRGLAAEALSYTSTKLWACEDYLGKQAEVSPAMERLNTHMIKIEAALTNVARDVVRERIAPFQAAVSGLSATSAPTTWDQQVTYVRAAFDVLGLAKNIVANEARYAALGAFDSNQYGPEWAIPEAKKQIAALGPTIVAALGEVSFPKVSGKDPKRAQVTKDEAIMDKKVLNGPFYTANSKESYDEVDAEEHVTRRVKREIGTGYYVSQPATWTQPVPDGVPVADLCELHAVQYMKYTAGGASYKKVMGRWMMQVDRYAAPILCKNAKRVSKLP